MAKVLCLVTALLAGGVGGDEGSAGRDALKAASQLRRTSFGKKGEEKHDILVQAAAAYEQIVEDHGDEIEVAAEAWYRAGEIHRSLRQVDEARRCFTSAAALEQVATFAARASNELGHLARRLKRWDEALEHYASVEKRWPDERTQCVRALTWSGKVLILAEREEAGWNTLLSVRERFPEFPLEHIRNVDTVACAWLRADRVPEARRLVEECLERHGTPPEGEDEVDEEVRKALERMRARELLQSEDG